MVESRRLDGAFQAAVRRLSALLVEAASQDLAGHQPTLIFSTAPPNAFAIGQLGQTMAALFTIGTTKSITYSKRWF